MIFLNDLKVREIQPSDVDLHMILTVHTRDVYYRVCSIKYSGEEDDLAVSYALEDLETGARHRLLNTSIFSGVYLLERLGEDADDVLYLLLIGQSHVLCTKDEADFLISRGASSNQIFHISKQLRITGVVDPDEWRDA